MSFALARYATTNDGVNIAYACAGDGDPVVFSSNFGGDVHHYHLVGPEQRGLTDRLAALGWAVVRHDRRGMGASDRDISDWRFLRTFALLAPVRR